MIHGLDTGFLVAAEVREHAAHADARATLAQVLSAGDVIAIAPQEMKDAVEAIKKRFSSSCVTMRNLDQTSENADAARRFEPLKQAELDELRDALLAAGPTMCPNCDGRCAAAGGTKARLGDLARMYTYHEDHGIRGWARERYAELADADRDWSGADLAAAREACHNKLDFASILPEVDRLLG